MVLHQREEASSSHDATGDLPSGEIPAEPSISVTGDLPSGKRPIEEAKEEDVEMKEEGEEQQERSKGS